MSQQLTERQKKWLRLAVDAHKNSTSYMDIALRNQWEDNVRLYNNKHSKKSKYNTELFKKRSNIFRPKTRSAGMKFEAAAATAYFSTQKLVEITPENPKNKEQVISAKIMTSLLNHRLSKTIPWFRVLIGAAQEAWKMGICISHQYWDDEINGPRIDLIPPENFRIDPSADWIDPINDSPYNIRMIPIYIMDLRDRMKKKNEVPWFRTTKAELLQAKESFSDSIRTSRENNRSEDRKTTAKTIDDFDMVFVHENIFRKNGKDFLFYTLSDIAILSDPVPLESVYAHGRPYVVGSTLLEPFVVYKSGIPELTQSIQEEINYVANDRIDNVHFVLNKRYFAKRGRNTDYRSLLRNIPGSITLMDNPMEDVQVIETNDITQSSYIEQDRLNVDFDELAGNFSAGSVQTNRALNETVGGMGMIQSGAGQITEYLLRNFNETWVEPVIRQLVLIEQQYESEAVIRAMAADDKDAKYMQVFGQSAELNALLANQMTVNVNVGITATNPQMKVERFIFAMKALGEVLNQPSANMIDQTEVINEIFGHLGYKDGGRFFAALNGDEDPRVAQLVQQVQQLTQLVESKKIEAQEKYKIEYEKLQFEMQKHQLTTQEMQVEMKKDTADMYHTLAQVRKIDAEVQQMMAGVDTTIEDQKILIELEKLRLEKEKMLRDDKTKRDKILADWEMQREELQAKLSITETNRGGVSKNIVDLKQKSGNKVKQNK